MANRYTNLTPATFNPMSVEEIMMVPLARQKMHDDALASSEEMGIFDVNRLQVDDQEVQKGIDSFKQQLTGIQDQIFEKGADKSLTRNLLKLKRERDSFLSNDGVGGRAQNAYNAYQENVKNILANKEATASEQQEQIMFAKRQYEESGGVANNAQYNYYQGFDSVDVTGKLVSYGDKLEPVIKMTSGWYRDPNEEGLWRNGERTTRKLPIADIQEALAKAATGDKDIMDYLMERQRINPGFDARETLMSAINGVSSLFTKDDDEFKSYMKFDTRKGSGDDNTAFGRASYDNYVDKVNDPMQGVFTKVDPYRKKRRDKKLSDNEFKKSSFNRGLDPTRPGAKAVEDAIKSEIEQEVKVDKRQEEVGKRIFGDNFNLSNEKNVEKFNNYIDVYGPIMGNSNMTIMDPSAMQIGTVAEGVSKDESKWKEAVNKRFRFPGTKFIANGKFYNSRKELMDDMKLEQDEVSDAVGILQYDNSINQNLPKGAEKYRTDFTEPIVFTVKVDNNYVPVYMSRKDGDLGGSPSLTKGYSHLNSTLQAIRNVPATTSKVKVNTKEGDKEVNVKYDYIEGTNQPSIHIQMKEGEPYYPISRQQLEDSVLNYFDKQ